MGGVLLISDQAVFYCSIWEVFYCSIWEVFYLSAIGFQRLQNIINVYTNGHTPNGTVYTIEL